MTTATAKPPTVLSALFHLAVLTAITAYCAWRLFAAQLPVAPVPYLIGAAAFGGVIFAARRLSTGRFWLLAIAYVVAFALLPLEDATRHDYGTGFCTALLASCVFVWYSLGRAAGKAVRRARAAGETGGGRMIVALSGYAGAGKDTAAAPLLENGWTRVSFADKLRDFALAVDPLVPSYATEPLVDGESAPIIRVERLSRYVERVGGWTEAKKNPEVRALLQRIGTDAGRRILGENVWVDAAMTDLPEGNIIITDARFSNEALAVREADGYVIRVERPGVTAVNAHESETALDDYPFDATLVNDDDPDMLGMVLAGVLVNLKTARLSK